MGSILGSPLFRETTIFVRRTPHPVIVTIMDYKDDIGVVSYSYYTTITGWGVLLTNLRLSRIWGSGATLEPAGQKPLLLAGSRYL